MDSALDHAPDPLDSPERPHGPEQQGRQKSTAALKSFGPSVFLARISAPLTANTVDIIEDVRSHYAVPDGVQEPGVESDGYRVGLKQKADAITRSPGHSTRFIHFLPRIIFQRQQWMNYWRC